MLTDNSQFSEREKKIGFPQVSFFFFDLRNEHTKNS